MHIAAQYVHIATICDILQQYVTYCSAICHIAVDMLHSLTICHIAADMLHSVAICHIAVDMSNRSKICPNKMKQIF